MLRWSRAELMGGCASFCAIFANLVFTETVAWVFERIRKILLQNCPNTMYFRLGLKSVFVCKLRLLIEIECCCHTVWVLCLGCLCLTGRMQYMVFDGMTAFWSTTLIHGSRQSWNSWNLKLFWNLSHLVQMSWYWPLLSVPGDSLMSYLQQRNDFLRFDLKMSWNLL